MAALSNPAGLATLPSQTAFSGEIFNPVRSTNFGFGDTGSHTNVYAIPALGWSAPAGSNVYFGGGIYGTSGLGVNYMQPSTPMGAIQAYSSIDFMQMAPALALKLSNKLSVGLAINVAAEQVSFDETFGGQGFNLTTPTWAYGVGATVGGLYKYNDKMTFGASYRSAMKFTHLYWQESQEFVPTGVGESGPVGVSGGPGTYEARLNYPQQVAFGAAFYPVSKWLVSVEGQWINWHSTMSQFKVFGPWVGTGAVALPMNWQNQWVANLGTQYNVSKSWQVRAGFAYGSNPIHTADLQANLIMPAIVTTAVTFGATQKLPMRWSLTEAAMHTFKATSTDGTLFGMPIAPLQASMSENSIGFQIGYYF
jgi:long-chain fatty acid transport protein